jgi:hypothetical protein
MSWLSKIFSPKPEREKAPDSSPQPLYGFDPAHDRLIEADLEMVCREHQADLDQALTPQRRNQILMTWRQTLDTEAHDFADLVLRLPQRERVLQMEVETMMQAYLRGYMARQGWISEPLALQSPYVLGRRLRDGLRAMGVSLNSLNANLGTVMSSALTNIARLGMQP